MPAHIIDVFQRQIRGEFKGKCVKGNKDSFNKDLIRAEIALTEESFMSFIHSFVSVIFYG